MNRIERTIPRTDFLMKGFYPSIIDSCITELSSIHSYMDRVASFLSDEQNNFRNRLEKEIQKDEINKEEAYAFYDSHYENIQELHSFFPTALRSSVLTFAFSLFESRLVEACKYRLSELFRG